MIFQSLRRLTVRTPGFHPGNRSSILLGDATFFASVAQSVEQLTFNQLVVGSSPAGSTILKYK